MRYSITGTTAAQIAAIGGSDIRCTRSGSIVFARLTDEQAKQLKTLGYKVEPVSKIGLSVLPPPVPVSTAPLLSPRELVWGMGFERLRELTVPPLYGVGLTIAVIDTGIRSSHELIGEGRIIERRNYTSDAPGDGFDHGTGVASIIVAMAPGCSLLDFKVLDSAGMATEEEVVLAIDDCIALRDEASPIAPHLINLSLGAADTGDSDNPLRTICREAIAHGIWVVAAAGNSGPAQRTVMSPACERYVVAVGSCAVEPFGISEFSSRGPTLEGLIKPDTVFIGENIVMASSLSDSATVAKSGTSFAAPFVSGIGALYQEGWFRMPVEFTSTSPWGFFPELEGLAAAPDVSVIIDRYLSAVSVKPQGAPGSKDSAYGDGMVLGSLLASMFVRPFDVAQIVQPLLMISMMAAMMKVIK